MSDSIEHDVKSFVQEQFLSGEDPAELTATTPLITGGILDSIATLKLVLFLEERWGVELAAHEVSPDTLDTIELIAKLVRDRKG